jgi:hypothetical protein
MRDFAFWKNRYDANDLSGFNFDASGLLWLKLKSLARKDLFDRFLVENALGVNGKTLNQKWEAAFDLLQYRDLQQAHEMVDAFICQTHLAQAQAFDERKLVSELYKIRYYDWGGDYKNSLDKYLVDDFIKIYQSYDELTAKLDNEIARSVQGYVLCSWYNHWSAILIENIFKAHPTVLPTVGQIKKVDFFVSGIPFDLKVTHLPANFIEDKRKSYGLRPELTELKRQARKIGIEFQTHKKAADTYYEIVQKLQDRDTEDCRAVLTEIGVVRRRILAETCDNPRELIKNLYEKQGEMRFDASNRLFLILVDSADYDGSWKLRRNLDLLKPTIQQYLDAFAGKDLGGLQTSFMYSGKEYQCLADCIFVRK